MFDLELLAQTVKYMVAARCFFLAGKAISKLAAVIGEQLDDLDGAGFFHFTEEVNAAVIGLILIDFHADPSRCTVDGNEQVAALRLVRHLR